MQIVDRNAIFSALRGRRHSADDLRLAEFYEVSRKLSVV